MLWTNLKYKLRTVAVMYAVNVLNGSNVYDLIYDQTKMREYFNCLFWTTKNYVSTLQKKKYRKSGYTQRNIFTMERTPTFG